MEIGRYNGDKWAPEGAVKEKFLVAGDVDIRVIGWGIYMTDSQKRGRKHVPPNKVVPQVK